MSRWYKAKATIINKYLVEVEDDQDEEAAAYEAVESVNFEIGDLVASVIDPEYIETYVRFADSDKFILRKNSK